MRPLLLALSLLPLAAAQAGDGDLRTVAGFQNHNRVLLVFAPDLADPRLKQQNAAMARFATGAAERDLVLVQVSPGAVLGARDDAGKLRHRFKVAPGDYRSLLIGKDGHTALAVNGPIDEQRLATTIDAMPMRRDEVRRARSGRPAATS
jgi:hypothetical protein